ncbi:MliC family protein [Marinobacter sp. X15-166B]|uniref:MliC family protein n=1 Tax=Marinobacter sp. X15-166B TaxID=1897620 RepID=UPI00085C0765|nr:MliC family protein [Marinobacter sp. X15-166B]OEY65962.1 hypothetical protein BG841_05490 [Marinobacter sp. X15-166B]
MNPLVLLTSASVLILSACTHPVPHSVNPQGPSAVASPSQVYQCASGVAITVSYPSTESAELHYKGRTYRLQIAVSGSGARYVGDRLEWWVKGAGPEAEGTLFRQRADGTSGDTLEHCSGA